MSQISHGPSRSQFDIDGHIGRKLDDVERDLIMGTLARCGGNRTWASDILGISVRTLRNKLLRYNDANEVPAKLGRSTRVDEDAYLVQLQEFDTVRRLPS